ncbi:hypothetical protein B0H13DRAFT_1875603 [Mycena leptocephala]|nr:hypothetical protein B0H13DRAFT_1875603 [Mycena leptocephala]
MSTSLPPLDSITGELRFSSAPLVGTWASSVGHRGAEAEDVLLLGVDMRDLPALLLCLRVYVDVRSQTAIGTGPSVARRRQCCKPGGRRRGTCWDGDQAGTQIGACCVHAAPRCGRWARQGGMAGSTIAGAAGLPPPPIHYTMDPSGPRSRASETRHTRRAWQTAALRALDPTLDELDSPHGSIDVDGFMLAARRAPWTAVRRSITMLPGALISPSALFAQLARRILQFRLVHQPRRL